MNFHCYQSPLLMEPLERRCQVNSISLILLKLLIVTLIPVVEKIRCVWTCCSGFPAFLSKRGCVEMHSEVS